MNILLLTNEFPPHIYGGAGIHVQYLSRELAKLMPVHVRCFGDQNVASGNLSALGFSLNSDSYTCPKPLRSVFGALQRCLDFNTLEFKAELVHCHTWYVHWGGILAKLNYGIPLVVTVHSLEPLRPWKREQLGGGYDFTCWLEKTAIEMAEAVIAVSRETRAGAPAPLVLPGPGSSRGRHRGAPRGLRDRRSGRVLAVAPGGEPGVARVGDLEYRVGGEVVDLGLFARQPLLWAGNPSLRAFAPCKDGWDVPLGRVSPQVRPAGDRGPSPPAGDEPATPLRDAALNEAHEASVRALFGQGPAALEAIGQLAGLLSRAEPRLAWLVRRRLETLLGTPTSRRAASPTAPCCWTSPSPATAICSRPSWSPGGPS